MDAIQPTTAETAANRAVLVCVRCLYTLTGLPADSVCPECATPIRRSIEAQTGVFPSPERLRPAGRAVNAILCSIISSIVLLLSGFYILTSLASDLGVIVSAAILLLCWVIWHLGWIRLATIDPTVPPERRLPQSNRALRAVSVLAALTPFAALAIGMFFQSNAPFDPGGLISVGLIVFGTPTLLLAQIALAAPTLSRIATSPKRPDGYGRRLPDMWIARLAAAAIACIALGAAVGFLGAWGAPVEAAFYLLLLAFGAILLFLLGNLVAALITARSAMNRARGRLINPPPQPTTTPP